MSISPSFPIMEIHFPLSFNITILIVPFFFFFFLKLFIQTWIKITPSPNKLPPGPKKLPFIGNLLNVAGSLPHRSLAALSKKYGPIMHLKLGEVSAIVISSPHLVKEVLTTNSLAFASRAGSQATKIMFYDHMDFAFSPYGDYWRQMRKICNEELLSVAKVHSLCSIREEEALTLVESIRINSGFPVNLSENINSSQYMVITRAAVGNSSMDQDTLIDIIKETLSAAGGFNIVDFFPSLKFLNYIIGSTSKLKKLHHKYDQILDNIINAHSENLGKGPSKEEDLLDVLLRLKESHNLSIPITTTNIKAVILDMFSGGTDTSSTIIEWAMAEMMRNPRVMEKAQRELKRVAKGKKIISDDVIQNCHYLRLVIKETMRMHTPVPFLVPRECRKECEISGYKIPIKTHLFLNAWAIARDPEYWKEAESFLPERFENTSRSFYGNNFEFVPFGAGKRMCPGISFGITNVEFTLAQLLLNFDWKLPDGMSPEDLDMTESFGITLRLKNSLFVVATPRSSL